MCSTRQDYCKSHGHLAKVCRARLRDNRAQKNNITFTTAAVTADVTSDDGYVFSSRRSTEHKSLPTCIVQVEGQSIKMTVDSGASVNIMDITFNIQRSSSLMFLQSTVKVCHYGSQAPLPVLGVFVTKMKFHSTVIETRVHVVDGATVN
ncbi:hypothetical protein LSAT2_008817 [Lamellibrachia satsuma]|nr:hypothetical protein LSAT2_008817 [Lamellibrachia satsuma]